MSLRKVMTRLQLGIDEVSAESGIEQERVKHLFDGAPAYGRETGQLASALTVEPGDLILEVIDV